MRPSLDPRHVRGYVECGLHAFQRSLRVEEQERPARDGPRVHGVERLVVRPGVVEQAPHDVIDAVELPPESSHQLGIRAAAAQHVDVGPHCAERVAHFVGDARRQPPDARQLLGAHQLALGVEQIVGHAIQPLGKGREIAGFGLRRARIQVACRDGLRCGDQPIHRPEDQAIDEVAPEEEEDGHLERHERHQHPVLFSGGHERRHDRRRHPDEQGGGGEEGQVEEQLRPERRLGGHGAHNMRKRPQTPRRHVTRSLQRGVVVSRRTYGFRLAACG